MTYTGIYINLDRSTERRAVMEDQLTRLGLRDRYQRFSAVEGNQLGLRTSLTDSQIGCFTSHHRVLKENLGSQRHLHVVEDDAVFSSRMETVINHLISSKFIDQFDILCLDTTIDRKLFRETKEIYDACVARDEQGNIAKIRYRTIDYIAGPASYLVNASSIKKLISIYDEAFAGGPEHCFDMTLAHKRLSGAIRIEALFPFVSSVRLGVTTTSPGRKYDDISVLAMNMARHSFFVDCDMPRLLDYAENALPPTTRDPHFRLLSRVFAFVVTPQYKKLIP